MIAFFDFDGTITTRDTLVEFIKYAVGKYKYYIGLLFLSPILIGYILKVVPNNIAKEKMLSYFFKDWDIKRFQEIANSYSLYEIDKIVNPKALERIRWHKLQKHKIVIVSASISCWIESWAKKEGFDLVSTKLEVIDNRLTGKFLTKNCYGEEKVRRIKELYNLNRYQNIYVYGDSRGDKEMLSLATSNYAFYKIF